MESIDVTEAFLEERSQLGLDKKDELWDGVLHMVPPAFSQHGLLAADLIAALAPIARRRQLRILIEAGVFENAHDYRVPDCSLAKPEQISERGLDSAELVIEVLSPNDESRNKFSFYAKVGVREVWLIDPAARATEIYSLVDGAYVPVDFVDGVARSPRLGIELSITGGKLRISDGDEVALV
jgi:Uma2 family endonuclease